MMLSMENDYSDLLFDPELHDYNDDGVIDRDEYIMGYLEEEYECEQIFGRHSSGRRGFSLGELAALSMFLLLIDIIFDGICGGRHSRVGKRMRRGGYKKRSSGGHGGGFFASIFAAVLVGCVASLWSHPRTKHNGFRRSLFKRQPAPKPPKTTKRTSGSDPSSRSKRGSASTTSQRVRHEASAGKTSASASEKTETVSHSSQKTVTGTPSVSSGANTDSAEQRTEQSEKKEPKPVRPKKGTTITTNRTTSAASHGGTWRQTCEDGTKYGLDPNNYDSEQQYLDALNTAKFADQFRF